jgi:hypothetical protein
MFSIEKYLPVVPTVVPGTATRRSLERSMFVYTLQYLYHRYLYCIIQRGKGRISTLIHVQWPSYVVPGISTFYPLGAWVQVQRIK